tara:strand:- start:1898 stop:2059 length:162 start_codon:yes stop_codon:yes gene_type:complete
VVVKEGVEKLKGELVNMENSNDQLGPRVVVKDVVKRRVRILTSHLQINIVKML